MSTTTPRRTTVRVPVVEVFGPTIQGEGPLAGVPSHFVRVGGCDYRCSWCDSLYAVEPDAWSHTAERMLPGDIVAAVTDLGLGARWVTLSGGNPGLYPKLGLTVDALRQAGYLVAVETQGSRWQTWMTAVDCLVLSPKPPSSGMVSERHAQAWRQFVASAVRTGRTRIDAVPATALKVVVFDQADYDYAMQTHAEVPWWPFYLSVGTDPGSSVETILERYRWLAETVTADPAAVEAHVLPQLHVLIWGHARGV